MTKQAEQMEEAKQAAPAGKAAATGAKSAAPGLSPGVSASKLAGILKGAGSGARQLPPRLPNKAQYLKEIQSTFGNDYAQKVISGLRGAPNADKKSGAANPPSKAPAAKEPKGAPPPPEMASLLGQTEAEQAKRAAHPPKAAVSAAKPPSASPAAIKPGSLKPGASHASLAKPITALTAKPKESGKGETGHKTSPLKSTTDAKGQEKSSPLGGKGEAKPGGPAGGRATGKAAGKAGEKGGESSAGKAPEKGSGGATAPGGAGKGNAMATPKGGAAAKGQAPAGKGAEAKGGEAKGGEAKGGEKTKPSLRQDAGGGAIAGAGGGGGSGGGGGGASPKSPDQDPEFQKVKGKARLGAQHVKKHEPAAAKASQAQEAAVGPANEIPSKAAANQTGDMDKAKPKPFSKEAFKAALLEKIQSLTPKNLEEADDFKDSGKAGQIKSAVTSNVAAGKDESQGEVKAKSEATPNQSGIAPKPVAPLAPESAGAPPKDIGASAAAPKPKTASETSLQAGSKKLDEDWKKTELDDKAVSKSNEPTFKKGLAEKQKAQKDAAERPSLYREKEAGILQESQMQAQGQAHAGLESMQSRKSASMAKVAEQQGQGKSKDEQERDKVAAGINAIFLETRSAVEKQLKDLDKSVHDAFDSGSESARVKFEGYVDRRMRDYKDDRYGGFGGGALWLKDKFLGMPDEVNVFYSEGRDQYLADMEAVIDKVAALVESGLAAAKNEIAQGKAKIDKYVNGLDPSLRAMGKEEAGKFEDKFADLEQSIEDKQGELVDGLAQKYVANLKKLDERIEEMKAANKGLVDAAIGAIKAIIETIIKLKNMLFNLLAKVASAIKNIIKDPIGFLGNLVSAVKGGILGFKERIAEHLQGGLMGWLMGAMGNAGITLPPAFDLKGILSLVLQVLGLTKANIRARAVTIVGEPVVKAMETGAGLFMTLMTEGPAACWDEIKGMVGDVKTMIMDGIRDWVITKIIVAGVTWLISMLNPASAFIKACKMIYDVVIFFVQRAAQIIEFVNSVVDSIAAIAAGSVGAASAAIEKALARSIPIVLSFLAALLGLNGISEKIRSLIDKIRNPINKAIDWLISKAVALVKAAGKIFGVGKKNPKEKTEPGKDGDDAKSKAVKKKVHDDAAGKRIQGPGQAEALIGALYNKYAKEGLKGIKLVYDPAHPKTAGIKVSASAAEIVAQLPVTSKEEARALADFTRKFDYLAGGTMLNVFYDSDKKLYAGSPIYNGKQNFHAEEVFKKKHLAKLRAEIDAHRAAGTLLTPPGQKVRVELNLNRISCANCSDIVGELAGAHSDLQFVVLASSRSNTVSFEVHAEYIAGLIEKGVIVEPLGIWPEIRKKFLELHSKMKKGEICLEDGSGDFLEIRYAAGLIERNLSQEQGVKQFIERAKQILADKKQKSDASKGLGAVPAIGSGVGG